jgi:hypothetical protein
MDNQQHHEMVLQRTRPSGEEEWYCSTCGRRMLISWEPGFKRTVLEPGDDYASHSGGKGGLRMGPLQIEAADTPSPREDPQPTNEDARLLPWSEWLKKSDFESRWDAEA